MNLNTNLWQNFWIWESLRDVSPRLKFISCLNSKSSRKEFCTAALCSCLELLLENTSLFFFCNGNYQYYYKRNV